MCDAYDQVERRAATDVAKQQAAYRRVRPNAGLRMNPQHVAHANSTYIEPHSEGRVRHKASQPSLCWLGRS